MGPPEAPALERLFLHGGQNLLCRTHSSGNGHGKEPLTNVTWLRYIIGVDLACARKPQPCLGQTGPVPEKEETHEETQTVSVSASSHPTRKQ